ncbi:hypothetical protein CYY_005477 [Polysphondylium violaceum]|uniref:Queuine tRNA-ribosyltransferase accessory subunit 2 n=1 Tax=Polysphondylium violaceum TaxID=133409 RepID=A0A8J4PT01_9MYCE|nr:hypothetical protein CYY_005477 [Polysphondylium violaceum]
MSFQVTKAVDNKNTTTTTNYRCGRLNIGDEKKPLITPTFMLYTKEGSPINLTKDLLNGLPNEKVHSLQLLFSDLYQFKDVLEKYQKGVHEFLSLNEHILFLLFRDSANFSADQEFKDDSINVTARKGKTKVDVQEYNKIINVIRPDLASSLSVDLDWNTGKKKAIKQVQCTLSWLNKLIELQETTTTTTTKQNLLGVIQGCKYSDLRIKSVEETIKHDSKLSGYVLGSFGTGESNQERAEILEKVLEKLPKEKLKIISGVGSPEEILCCVEQGIDVFSTNYPNLMTEWGNALTFTFKLDQFKSVNNSNKINLWDTKYVIDTTPLVKDCPCFTCTQHTKAYIHHLLNTHEMLAQVLLTIHNVSHYLGFFEEIRKTIESNQFEQYKQQFLAKRLLINNKEK